MLAYQGQDCAATLAEGIGAYYDAHPSLKRGAALSAEAQEFFRCHDAVHVVYGCDTSLPHEAIVKLSSFFGTTEGLGVMRGYRLYESLDIYRQLRTTDILRTIAAAPVIVPRTLWRCSRQTRRWPWAAFEAFMDVRLRDIRADFGIRVATWPERS
jgi:ubiquinone biosynthesis protein Coq4